MSLISQVSGTPYVPGGDTPAGTDCSGLASWVANVASGRPAFGSRFTTGNMESALLARGFQYGTAPNSVVIGWNGGHAAVTLPDGTPVSSGESGSGVRVGGGGAYQPQFVKHMFLPVDVEQTEPSGPSGPSGPLEPAPPGEPVPPVPPIDVPQPPPPADPVPPADFLPPAPPGDPTGQAPAGELPTGPPAGADLPPADALQPPPAGDPDAAPVVIEETVAG